MNGVYLPSQFGVILIPLAAIQVKAGDKLRVTCQYSHRGNAESVTLYAAIGNSGAFGFDEILHGSKTLSVPEDASWHFRYELNDRGPEHSFTTACIADAIKQATNRRLPPYHMHIAEKSALSDDLHYPIGEPTQPLDLVFEVLRLVKDEFVSN